MHMYAKFQYLGPFSKKIIAHFLYWLKITHSANKCIKIGRKIGKFKFKHLALLGIFQLS